MAALLRTNFARGTLASGIDALVTQMTLEIGHTLPIDAGNFRVVIWNMEVYNNPADDPNTEIVTASYSGTPNIYNIIRAQEDTLAVLHATGSEVALHYTAGISEDDLNYLGTYEIKESDVGHNKAITAYTTGGVKQLKYTGPYQKVLIYDEELVCFLVT